MRLRLFSTTSAHWVLLLHVWMAAWPRLTRASRKSPPTHLQLLIYYHLLGSKMEPHRDNSAQRQIDSLAAGDGMPNYAALLGTQRGGANSQTVGTNVLVYTTGNAPMTFTLRGMPRADVNAKGPTCYLVVPRFQMRCGSGTLSILDPLDDVTFFHGADFVAEVDGVPLGASSWRKAYTFRWLETPQDFYVDTRGLRLNAEQAAKMEAPAGAGKRKERGGGGAVPRPRADVAHPQPWLRSQGM